MKENSFLLFVDDENQIHFDHLDYIEDDSDSDAYLDFRYNSLQLTIDLLFVEPELRGLGLAKSLLNKVIDFSKKEKVKRIKLMAQSFYQQEVDEDEDYSALKQNKLVKFYESFGFQTSKITSDGSHYMELYL